MRRIFCTVMIIVLAFPVIGLADIPDISELSTIELLELNAHICQQLKLSDDFDPFEVPIGYWTVGENLPEGTYSIKVAKGKSAAVSIQGSTNDGKSYIEVVDDEKYFPYVVVVTGAVIKISGWPVIFAPAETVKFGSL